MEGGQELVGTRDLGLTDEKGEAASRTEESSGGRKDLMEALDRDEMESFIGRPSDSADKRSTCAINA